MSATRRQSSRPPTFTTYSEVEVDIDADELEDAGWVYVGKGQVSSAGAFEIVRAWHDEAHEGPWQWCGEQPCDALRGRTNG